jgi:hypothetical protein
MFWIGFSLMCSLTEGWVLLYIISRGVNWMVRLLRMLGFGTYLMFGAPILLARGASVRQYIGAPMSLSAIIFFSCSDRHSYWRRVLQCAISIGGI